MLSCTAQRRAWRWLTAQEIRSWLHARIATANRRGSTARGWICSANAWPSWPALRKDPLGQQARRIWKEGELEVWIRPLKGGEYAVVLFNRGPAPAEMTVRWDQLNLPADLRADVKDLWSKKVSKNARGTYGGTVASHGVVMVRITPLL